MISISIVEDNRDIREGLRLLLDGSPGMYCLAAYRDAETALAGLEQAAPEVLLLDIELPGRWGVEVLPDLRRLVPATHIVMLTVHEEDDLVFEALCAGACGYLLKTTLPRKLLAAIREVCAGGAPMSSHIARRVLRSFRRDPQSVLTGRESDILRRLCDGLSYKMIAVDLGISRGTVHCHIKSIYKKLQVHSSSQAVALALREKLV